MDLARIRELLKIVAESDMAEVEIEEEGVKIVARKNVSPVMMQVPSMMAPYPMGYPQGGWPAPYPAPGPAPMPAPQPAAPAPSAPAPAAPAPAPEKAEEKGVVIKAPIVGTFYEASSPEASPYVTVGDTVKVGQILCIIEAMKLMNEIEAEMEGVVTKILVKNAEPVEYDQPLFVINPA